MSGYTAGSTGFDALFVIKPDGRVAIQSGIGNLGTHSTMDVHRVVVQNRPPSILDAPQHMAWDALDIPDPETPVGARGIGEPPVGGACAAVLNAISAAIGDDMFRRVSVMPDVILTSIEAGRLTTEALTAHI